MAQEGRWKRVRVLTSPALRKSTKARMPEIDILYRLLDLEIFVVMGIARCESVKSGIRVAAMLNISKAN